MKDVISIKANERAARQVNHVTHPEPRHPILPPPDNPCEFTLGRKLPAHSLWEQLQRQALALEFCSRFFHNRMSYARARQWLADCGIKISITALFKFYHSPVMLLRYVTLVLAPSEPNARTAPPADAHNPGTSGVLTAFPSLSQPN